MFESCTLLADNALEFCMDVVADVPDGEVLPDVSLTVSFSPSVGRVDSSSEVQLSRTTISVSEPRASRSFLYSSSSVSRDGLSGREPSWDDIRLVWCFVDDGKGGRTGGVSEGRGGGVILAGVG